LTRLQFRGFGGVRLAGDAFGSPGDPSILMLPAGGQTKETLHAAAAALAEAGRYAICVDLRGHGESQYASDGRYDLDAYVEDVRAVLAQLPARPVVIGVSVGGLAALAALGESDTPLATGLLLVGVTLWVDAAVQAEIVGRFRSLEAGFDSLEDVRLAIAQLHPQEPEPTLGQLSHSLVHAADERYYWRWDPRATGQLDLARASARLEAAARQLTVPTLLIRGASHETADQEAPARIANLIPGAESVEIPGAGHLVVTECTDDFNAAIIEFLERRVPREQTTYLEGSDPRLLREALGCFGTGVTVVTTLDDAGRPIGLTANSFTSVSLDPPLILFCLAKSSASLAIFERAAGFAVNVLQIGQQAASSRFARRDGERFEGHDWERWGAGSPILKNALASFDCAKFAEHPAGDHVVFIGTVRQVRFSPQRDPLLFFRGRYRRLHFA
jgi:flavin reductase (DIM6/NTAB) family NADH-FMN oxidoreductase RutF/pimeloyl-ACP methyl ester carboxylesterase